MMRTYKSSSFNAPIETAQLDEIQVERLDLGKHAVEGGPIQNTCQQRVFTLQLRHHRLKRRKGGRAKVARDPNRVQTRSLVHLSNGQDSRGESASPGSSERVVSWLPRHGGGGAAGWAPGARRGLDQPGRVLFGPSEARTVIRRGSPPWPPWV